MPIRYDLANIRRRRLKNALWGLFIGDALAMPAHWYYNTGNITKDFDGGIRDYTDAPHPHPESFMVKYIFAAGSKITPAVCRPMPAPSSSVRCGPSGPTAA